jgi:hypothetical protein
MMTGASSVNSMERARLNRAGAVVACFAALVLCVAMHTGRSAGLSLAQSQSLAVVDAQPKRHEGAATEVAVEHAEENQVCL